MAKKHKSDEGILTQVDMKFDTLGRPNPVFRCNKCGQIVSSAEINEIADY